MKKIVGFLVLALVTVGCGLEEGKKHSTNMIDADGGTTIVIDHVNVDDVNVDHADVNVDHAVINVATDAGTPAPKPDSGTPDAGPVADKTAPDILTLTVTDITASSATVNVTTDEASTVQVVYNLTAVANPTRYARVFSIGLTDLTAGTTYRFTVTATDGSGNKSSEEGSFTTSALVLAPEALPAPFKVNGKYAFGLSVDYISGSLCGKTKVFFGPMATDVALMDRDATTGAYDGYLSTSMPSLASGEYRMSYVDDACPGETLGAQGANWADYGNMADLVRMTSEARAFIDCAQYVSADNKCQTVTNPGCEIRFSVASDGTISPKGNMAGLTQNAAGCF